MSILAELFMVFFKLGTFTIGGGIAMLPLLQNAMIEEKKWIRRRSSLTLSPSARACPEW